MRAPAAAVVEHGAHGLRRLPALAGRGLELQRLGLAELHPGFDVGARAHAPPASASWISLSDRPSATATRSMRPLERPGARLAAAACAPIPTGPRRIPTRWRAGVTWLPPAPDGAAGSYRAPPARRSCAADPRGRRK